MEQLTSVSNWVTIIPPLVLIIGAVVTRDVIFSIILGIVTSAMIWAGGNPVYAFFKLSERTSEVVSDGYYMRILIFLFLLAGVIGLISKSGAVKAFGNVIGRFVKTKRSSLFVTYVLGILIFIDDYFNALTVGAVMRPLTDKNKVSRSKLAFVINSTGGPICILIPISSFVVYAMSVINRSPGFAELNISALNVFMHSIPYNFYAILVLVLVFAVILFGKDYGVMKGAEKRAEETDGKVLYNSEKYGKPLGSAYTEKDDQNGKKVYLIDMFLPLAVLITCAFAFFPIVGYMEAIGTNGITTFTQAFNTLSLTEAFDKTDSSKVLFYTSLITAGFTYCYYILRKLISFKIASDVFVDGMMTTIVACLILVLAWIFSGMMKGDVQTGVFVSNLIQNSNFPIVLLPPVLFIFCAVIAFSTGSSFATFGLMIPLAVQVTIELSTKVGIPADVFLHISIASILGGGIFGNQSSPVSDITIMSATAANVPHLEHVISQLYYTSLAVVLAFIGSLLISIYPQPLVILPMLIVVEIVLYLLIAKHANRIKQFMQNLLPGKKRKRAKEVVLSET